MAYTKLHQSLVTSTIWREPHPTRIVWITMLALADKNGEVQASIPGLADACRVTIQECEAALKSFMSPDKYSRTKTMEGRRIQEIAGGWELVNHADYRALASKEDATQKASARMARHRQRRNKAQPTVDDPQPLRSVTENRDIADSRGRVAEADDDPDPSKSDGDASCAEIYAAYPRKVAKIAALAAIAKALKSQSAEHLLDRTRAFAAAVAKWPASDEQFIPHPATWFNRGSFDDDPATWDRTGDGKTNASGEELFSHIGYIGKYPRKIGGDPVLTDKDIIFETRQAALRNGGQKALDELDARVAATP